MSAPDLYRKANDLLWSALHPSDVVERVQVDERMTSEVIARHLERADSPVKALLFDRSLRSVACAVKREVVHSGRNLVINRAEPDFFWYRRGQRLHPLVLVGAAGLEHYQLATDGTSPDIAESPDAFAAALRNGELYGDRFLSYVVRCLLPGVVAVGGTVQQDYVANYRDILLETDRLRPFLSDSEREVVGSPGLSRLGGAALIELNAGERSLLSSLADRASLEDFDRTHLEQTVRENVGRLSGATFYEEYLRRRMERALGGSRPERL